MNIHSEQLANTARVQIADLWRLASCLLGAIWERMDEAMRHAEEMNQALAWRDVGHIP